MLLTPQNHEDDLAALSQACEAAFASQQNDECHRLARNLSQAAAVQGLRSFEARGLLRQAQCALRDGQFADAMEAAQRAALLHEMTGDNTGEIESLCIAGHTAMLQHHNEDAIEAALLATRLVERLPASPLYVLAHTELGMVHGWCGNVAAADSALARAAEGARTIGQPQLAVMPQVKRLLARAVHRVKLHERGPQQAGRATEAVARPARAEIDVQALAAAELDQGDDCLRLGALALAACGAGDRVAASAYARSCTRAAQQLDSVWLQALGTWAKTELALLEQRLDDAAAESRCMLALAGAGGHEPLAELAQVLLSVALQRKGQLGQSLAILFDLYSRKAEQRAQALVSREQSVRWRLGVRDQTRRMQELERLSHEDPLTGLANRRAFDATLQAMVWQWQTQARPFALLLIDVDRFKQINDRHSHVLGDEVLCRIGDVLAGAVREGDLVARLGGDEFVLLLRHQGGRTAQGCVRQIEDAMRQHDWSQLAPALSVTLSIGLARIAQGDTAEQLVARADAAMYAHKARHGAHAATVFEEARAGV